MEPMEEEPHEPAGDEEPGEMEEEDERPPEVELTEEEKHNVFKKSPSGTPDLAEAVVNKCFSKFSVPQKDEGFDELKYDWQNAADSKEYLKKWVSERKRTAKNDKDAERKKKEEAARKAEEAGEDIDEEAED